MGHAHSTAPPPDISRWRPNDEATVRLECDHKWCCVARSKTSEATAANYVAGHYYVVALEPAKWCVVARTTDATHHECLMLVSHDLNPTIELAMLRHVREYFGLTETVGATQFTVCDVTERSTVERRDVANGWHKKFPVRIVQVAAVDARRDETGEFTARLCMAMAVRSGGS